NVNGCDAAALAGARELPNADAARQTALEVAAANGLKDPIRVSVIVGPSGTTQVGGTGGRGISETILPPGTETPDDWSITVTSEENVPLFFGRIFGDNNKVVNAHSTGNAEIPNIIRGNSPAGLRPWAIDQTTPLEFGTVLPIK